MKRRQRTAVTLVMSLLFLCSLVMVGCSSSPDEAQLRQLSDLKADYDRIQQEVNSKQQQKSDLERELAEKNAKLKKCNDDQQVVKQRLAK